MAFNPTSAIYLCFVPIDNTYTNQIYFDTLEEQQAYFAAKTPRVFTNYLTVRRTTPDGSMVSSIKVDCNIDDLYQYNYMFYQNANHGTKFFYAFITKLIYINEGTTEIVFETDVWQTWFYDVSLSYSYVVREHSETDEIGDNIVPEKFNFQDYKYTEVNLDTTDFSNWGYLVTTTDAYSDDTGDEYKGAGINRRKFTGIYQGLYFYFYKDVDKLHSFLKKLDKDSVVSISVIPSFNVSNNEIGMGEDQGEGWVHGDEDVEIPYNNSITPSKTYNFNFNSLVDYCGYEPKNNKLLTAPFVKLIVTNNSGEEAEYNFEDFSARERIRFTMYGDISINPSLTLIPLAYKGVSKNLMAGISIKNFPQCSYNTDTFKLWLTKNQFSLGMGMATSAAQIIGGAALTATGAGALVGGGLMVSGATGALNTLGNVYSATKEPNRGHSGNVQNNLLTAMNRNKFEFFVQTLKPEYMCIIDDFFTMYGYATNRVKKPNISSRPKFNYVQTIDCNIWGSIPDDDMRQMKAMFNKGVTFWKKNASIGNYNVNNSPS